MRILFFGSPAIALPYLKEAARAHSVVGVVTQSDKPAGRGMQTLPSAVKSLAIEMGLPVFQPEKPSAVVEDLKALKPDLSVMVAYGKLIKKDVLGVPRLGTINIHFSLLPRYRGAAPVQWALVHGETKTGVTVFWVEEGMDTGPVFLKRELEIGPDEDAPALFERLTVLGVSALSEVLKKIEAGNLESVPQSGEATMAPLIRREQARVDLARPARDVHNLVRGMRRWPRAYLESKAPSGRLLILKTALYSGEGPAGPPSSRPSGDALAAQETPGRIARVEREKGILVECGSSTFLWVVLVQPEGKRPTPAVDFLNGLRLKAGDTFPFYETRKSSDI